MSNKNNSGEDWAASIPFWLNLLLFLVLATVWIIFFIQWLNNRLDQNLINPVATVLISLFSAAVYLIYNLFGKQKIGAFLNHWYVFGIALTALVFTSILVPICCIPKTPTPTQTLITASVTVVTPSPSPILSTSTPITPTLTPTLTIEASPTEISSLTPTIKTPSPTPATPTNTPVTPSPTVTVPTYTVTPTIPNPTTFVPDTSTPTLTRTLTNTPTNTYTATTINTATPTPTATFTEIVTVPPTVSSNTTPVYCVVIGTGANQTSSVFSSDDIFKINLNLPAQQGPAVELYASLAEGEIRRYDAGTYVGKFNININTQAQQAPVGCGTHNYIAVALPALNIQGQRPGEWFEVIPPPLSPSPTQVPVNTSFSSYLRFDLQGSSRRLSVQSNTHIDIDFFNSQSLTVARVGQCDARLNDSQGGSFTIDSQRQRRQREFNLRGIMEINFTNC